MPDSKQNKGRRASRGRLVNPRFVKRMEAELQANGHKGNWKDWKPSKLGALSEIEHHVAKLIDGLRRNDRARVSEYAADVANACMRTAEIHGDLNQPEGTKARKK